MFFGCPSFVLSLPLCGMPAFFTRRILAELSMGCVTLHPPALEKVFLLVFASFPGISMSSVPRRFTDESFRSGRR